MEDISGLHLETSLLNPQIIYHEVLGSTNDFAKSLVSKGLGLNTVIIAGTQSTGRGRFDRKWESPLGGLYLSLVLEPPFSPNQFPILGLLMSCA